MFSATFPEEVQTLAHKYLHDFVFVNTGVVGGTNPDVEQVFYEVDRRKKRDKLIETLNEIGDARTIVFAETKKTADFLAAYLSNTEIKVRSGFYPPAQHN